MVCSKCGKPARSFVILSIVGVVLEIAFTCLYHYCEFYGLDIRTEGQREKRFLEAYAKH